MATQALNLYSRNKAVTAGTTESLAEANTPGSLTAAPFLYRVKAGGSAGDTAAGVGCRAIIIKGLDNTGFEVEEVIPTAGTNASDDGIISFHRINSIDPYFLGAALSTQSGTITVEKTVTGDVALLEANPGTWGGHQYTVPIGKRAVIKRISLTSDKDAFTLLVKRYKNSVLVQTAPWLSSEVEDVYHTIGSSLEIDLDITLDPVEMIWLRVTNDNGAEADITSNIEGTLYTL